MGHAMSGAEGSQIALTMRRMKIPRKLSQFFANSWCWLLEPGGLRHNPLIVKNSLPKAVYNHPKRLSYCHTELHCSIGLMIRAV
jgi:hypothetical protein